MNPFKGLKRILLGRLALSRNGWKDLQMCHVGDLPQLVPPWTVPVHQVFYSQLHPAGTAPEIRIIKQYKMMA